MSSEILGIYNQTNKIYRYDREKNPYCRADERVSPNV